jgi:hypothetical protein
LMLFGSVGRARVALAGVSFLRIAGAAARLTSAPLIFFFTIPVDRSDRRRSRPLGGTPRFSIVGGQVLAPRSAGWILVGRGLPAAGTTAAPDGAAGGPWETTSEAKEGSDTDPLAPGTV